MNQKELLNKVLKLIEEKKKLHINDPSIGLYWDKLTKLLSNDLEATKYVLKQVGEESLYHIAEVFEDISYMFQSSQFILFLEELDKKYPKANLGDDIKWAKEMLDEKIEQKLLEILCSYDKYDDVYDYINVIRDLNKEDISKKILTDILTKILSEVEEDKKIDCGLQIDILGTTLDYITGFCSLPPHDSPEGKFYYYFKDKA